MFGVVVTVLALVVFRELIREVGPSRSLVSVFVSPAVAIVAGVLILDEPLTALILASFVLILTGCALATRTEKAAPPVEADVLDDSRKLPTAGN